MQTVLFTSTIFGPIHSRRLGTSLGVNLMPNDGKICSFDCLYCEAGYNAQGPGTTGVAKRETLKKQLKNKLKAMHEAGLKRLPANLGEAVNRFESSELMRKVLGDHIHSYLVETKRAEWVAYLTHVSPWELDRYLAVL